MVLFRRFWLFIEFLLTLGAQVLLGLQLSYVVLETCDFDLQILGVLLGPVPSMLCSHSILEFLACEPVFCSLNLVVWLLLRGSDSPFGLPLLPLLSDPALYLGLPSFVLGWLPRFGLNYLLHQIGVSSRYYYVTSSVISYLL